jgi:hypothetical protein
LDDDRNPGTHCVGSIVDRLLLDTDPIDARDLEPRLFKVFYIAALVRKPALPESFEQRIVPYFRWSQLARRDRQIKLREIPAAQMTDKVGRAQLDNASNVAHGSVDHQHVLTARVIILDSNPEANHSCSMPPVYLRAFRRRAGYGDVT